MRQVVDAPMGLPVAAGVMEMYERLGDVSGAATSAFNLGFLIMKQSGDTEAAVAAWENCLAVFRGLQDADAVAAVLDALGWAAHRRGDSQRAKDLLEESIALLREVGDQHSLARALHHLGVLLAGQATVGAATKALAESVTLRQALGDRRGLAYDLEALAGVAVNQGRPELAARLQGACAVMLEATGLKRSPDIAQALGLPPSQLDLGEFSKDFASGRHMSSAEAVEVALNFAGQVSRNLGVLPSGSVVPDSNHVEMPTSDPKWPDSRHRAFGPRGL